MKHIALIALKIMVGTITLITLAVFTIVIAWALALI